MRGPLNNLYIPLSGVVNVLTVQESLLPNTTGVPRIKHVRNGGEQKVPTEKGEEFVDGFEPSTNTVYEFLGCLWHGCPTCCNHQRRVCGCVVEDIVAMRAWCHRNDPNTWEHMPWNTWLTLRDGRPRQKTRAEDRSLGMANAVSFLAERRFVKGPQQNKLTDRGLILRRVMYTLSVLTRPQCKRIA